MDNVFNMYFRKKQHNNIISVSTCKWNQKDRSCGNTP